MRGRVDDSPQIRTEAVDLYLSGRGALRVVTAAEHMAAIRQASRDPRVDDPEVLAASRLAAWRVVRSLAASLGLVAADETLEEALDGLVDPDPWFGRVVPRATVSQRAALRRGLGGPLADLVAQGLTLLPRGDEWDENWCEAAELVCQDVGVARGPHGGDVLMVLTYPLAARELALSPEDVYAVEELLVGQALRVLLRHGEAGVQDHFGEKYGLCRREANLLIRLARAEAMRNGRSTVEDDRALMVARLNDIAARARETLNVADELRALRELARVQGLTRTEPESVEQEFRSVIKSVSDRQDAERPLVALPREEDPTPEREELADFDREELAHEARSDVG
jgi:hypothetical protein